LRDFGADADTLVAGNVLHATVVPPVPWRLRMDIGVAGARRPDVVEAAIGGDVSGTAVIRLEPVDGGTLVTAAWSLDMRSRSLRVAARLAFPLMRWGHDRVVEQAVAGFRRRALGGTPRP